MFNIIAIIVVALIICAHLIHIAYDLLHKDKINFKSILVVAFCLAIVASAHTTQKLLADEYTKGYNDAIKSAELVRVNDSYCVIDFDGETHYYTIDGNELISIADAD